MNTDIVTMSITNMITKVRSLSHIRIGTSTHRCGTSIRTILTCTIDIHTIGIAYNDHPIRGIHGG